MKLAIAALLSISAFAQGWGRREAFLPVLQGRFFEAEDQFRKALDTVGGSVLLWEAEYEIERARFGQAAALLQSADRHNGRNDPLNQRRRASLYCAVGRFAEAYELALEGRKWNRQDVRKLKVAQPISLVTLAEVEIARGDYELARAISDKAMRSAKDVRDYSALEWVRSRTLRARADIEAGSPEAALDLFTKSYTTAEREWGSTGIPIIDFTDISGLAYLSLGDLRKAEEALTWALLQRKALYVYSHPKLADSYLHMGLLHVAQHRYSDAVLAVHRGLEMHKEFAVGGPNGRWALALLQAAPALAAAGNLTEAKTAYESAIPILERQLGPDAPRVVEARKRYAESSLSKNER